MEKILGLFFIICLALKGEFIVSSLQEIKNKELIRQNYEESCGAASLATLLNLIDMRHYSELDILKTINEKIDTNLMSFAELKKAAIDLGYQANAYMINREILNEIFAPILVKIENDPRFPHFVVIINYKGDFLKILDPNHGAYISRKSEFYSVWDKNKNGGYAILIVPKIPFVEQSLPLYNKNKFEFRPFGVL